MELNEAKFLEELRSINEAVRSAYRGSGRPRTIRATPTVEQKAEFDKETEEIDREFHKSIYEPLQRLSYLLSLVETDPFENFLRVLDSLIEEVLSTSSLNSSVIQAREAFYDKLKKINKDR